MGKYQFIRNVSWFISAYIAIAAFILIKKFAFDVVRINNKDMRGTYDYGDAVLIQKTFTSLNTGDVVYFQFPADDTVLTKTFVFQRIFGLPGDSLMMADKRVLLNGMQLQDISTLQHNYFVKTVRKIDSTFRTTYSLHEGGSVSDEYDYSFSLTGYQSEVLKKEPYVKSVTLKMEKKNARDESIFPGAPQFRWNSDQFGPIYIPRVNDTLRLDTTTIKLYSRLINVYEKNRLRVNGDSIIINDEPRDYYVVKKNYYFVLGDNRDNANDSRTWGLLPENKISGKVIRLIRKAR